MLKLQDELNYAVNVHSLPHSLWGGLVVLMTENFLYPNTNDSNHNSSYDCHKQKMFWSLLKRDYRFPYNNYFQRLHNLVSKLRLPLLPKINHSDNQARF